MSVNLPADNDAQRQMINSVGIPLPRTDISFIASLPTSLSTLREAKHRTEQHVPVVSKDRAGDGHIVRKPVRLAQCVRWRECCDRRLRKRGWSTTHCAHTHTHTHTHTQVSQSTHAVNYIGAHTMPISRTKSRDRHKNGTYRTIRKFRSLRFLLRPRCAQRARPSRSSLRRLQKCTCLSGSL
jgi:hypothetical protein